MNKVLYLVLATSVCASLAFAKPQINAKNGVRTLAATAASTTLARGSVFSIVGQELAGVDPVTFDVPYPQDGGGLTVALTTADDAATVQAYLLSTAPGKIVALVPSSTPAGDYKVTVTYNGETSDPFAVKVADQNFGLITAAGLVKGQAAGRVLVPETGAVAVTYTKAVTPGAAVEFDATGWGPIETPDNEFPAGGSVIGDAVIVVAGQEIPITYLGRNPARPGYDLVQFTLPTENVPTGCDVEFQIKYWGTTSSSFTMPLVASADAACTNPMGVSPASLDQLVSGGSIVFGGFTLTRQSISATIEGISMDTTTEAVAGGFESYNAEAFALYAAQNFMPQYLVNPDSGCYLFTVTDSDPAVSGPSAVAVDAGEKLALTGPGLTKDVPRVEGNTYTLSLSTSTSIGGGGFPSIPGIPSIPGLPNIPGLPGTGATANVLVAGQYKLTGPGGTVVGPFEATTDMTSPITWTNKDAITAVTRANNLSVLWSGGADSDLVEVTGLSRGPAPEDNSQVVNRVFTCWAKGSVHQIVVPSSLLQQLPVSSGVDISTDPTQVSLGSLSLQQVSLPINGLFTAPLVAGGNTEPGAFAWLVGWTKTLSYQ
ncbi:hypothetical protein [Paludibaculum fermentans]|uniref:hypothetical protein n=1 Tax=Paludibaculum fermentans TaxID=1473598 RepID=UPI003EC0E40C